MREIKTGTVIEQVIERSDYPLEQVRSTLADEVIAILGYGIQGRAQSLNLRDNGLNVIVGQRQGTRTWQTACDDGWKPGESLFEIPEAAQRGTIVHYLLSDAGQKEQWPTVLKYLTKGKALALAHGFSIVYSDQTGVVPPADIDVILVAPRGSGTTFRRQFLEGKGINAGFAIHQDATDMARDRCLALAMGIGCSHLFQTTFEREVFGDLTGERGSLLGAIYGLWLAQYEVLREHGHTPAEAFQETVEEATQSLYPLIAEKGLDWMYRNCSATAQRGALDWFRRFRDAIKPVVEDIYRQVAGGEETRRILEANSRPDYREQLEKELKSIAQSEMWQVGAEVRKLR
jgi:ketol-acid reductoisomerase